MRFYYHHLKRTDVREIALDNIRHVLEDDRKLFSLLKGSVVGNGLPSRKMMHGKIDPRIVDVDRASELVLLSTKEK